MKYMFCLGRIPSLSLAEISKIAKKLKIKYKIDLISEKVIIIDVFDGNFNVYDVFPKMGGTVKVSEILCEGNLNNTFKKIKTFLDKHHNDKNLKKKVIGYSIYFAHNQNEINNFETASNIRRIFIKMKKVLQAENIKIRLVFPDKCMELNAASIIKNKILENGAELNFVFSKNNVILTKTTLVQDIDSYSNRDYGRPKRESRIGMIPPKLAQIMLNLSQIKDDQIIFDPFCGVGTVLQEALLSGYRIAGSDANGNQIENCKRNLQWLSKNFSIKHKNYRLFQSDVKRAFEKFKNSSIDAVVTESTLGPIYKNNPSGARISQIYKNLRKVHLKLFNAAKTALKKKSKIVLTFPSYKTGINNNTLFPFIDELKKIGYFTVDLLDKEFICKNKEIFQNVTNRGTIIYCRPNQVVQREIVVFEKK